MPAAIPLLLSDARDCNIVFPAGDAASFATAKPPGPGCCAGAFQILRGAKHLTGTGGNVPPHRGCTYA